MRNAPSWCGSTFWLRARICTPSHEQLLPLPGPRRPRAPGTKEDTVQKLVDIPPDREILQYWTPTLTLEQGIRNVIASIEEMHGKVL